MGIGVVSMIFGGSALVSNVGGGSKIAALLASCCVVLGLLSAMVAVRLHRRSRYLFFASFLMLSGVFLLLFAGGFLSLPFARLWPLLSVFAGLSLLPAGWHRYNALKARFVVPALGFSILGCSLLFFSLGVVPFSLSRFVLDWWPVLLLLAGILLVLISFGGRSNGTEEPGP
jgi:hypothetical protein